ncbi:hypothetical protein [Methylobacterium sp. SD21]|uniref:hypothetical protein n=1 Tax=Methylobacterium litchii TaxID=3138810 RepID=UPI00313DF979
MIDLAALFQEATEELSGGAFPAFPVCGKGKPERQTIDKKYFSGISGVSGRSDRVNNSSAEKTIQARTGAGAGGRARNVPAEAPETPETPEKPAPAMGWLSGSSLEKPEKKTETGNRAALPGSLAAALPDFEERAAFLEYDCGLTRLAAEAQARAECQQAESAPLVLRPSLTAIPREDGLALWRAGIVALSPAAIPCPGYRGDEWECIRSQALDFLDRFGPQAEALGWTAARLFGVHPVAGIVRVDTCGALVLPSAGAVRAIRATEVSFGHLTYREKPGQPQGVPIWEFGR